MADFSGFKSVKNAAAAEITVTKSRFICNVKRVECDDEAKEFIQSVKKKYADARHNCYAYVLTKNSAYVKYSDDGEPQGTAGASMLEVLKNKGLYETAAVVTRYFGGVKLGVGGLKRAYADAVSAALLKAGECEFVYSRFYSVTVPQSMLKRLENAVESLGKKTGVTYLGATVKLDFSVPAAEAENAVKAITDLINGKAEIIATGEGYAEKK